jgi:rhamnosyltransferase
VGNASGKDDGGPPFRASVIVRAMDKADTIERALLGLRSQTVQPEVIVVDSGSQDGTVEIAKRHCDRLIEIGPQEFSYGRALNLGAAAASAPIHFALSAHCVPPTDDWIERSLAHYSRPDVAGTCGVGLPVPEWQPDSVTFQDAGHFRRHPLYGFSNHGSSWRANVWREFPFNEELPAAEDKEWAGRVLEAGWVLAFDPAVDVKAYHRFETGLLHYFRRQRRDMGAVALFTPMPRYGLQELFSDWWNVLPDGRRSRIRLRLSPWHLTTLAAQYTALRVKRDRG